MSQTLSGDIGATIEAYERYKREQQAQRLAEAQAGAGGTADTTDLAAEALAGAYERVMSPINLAGHVAGAPARLVAGAATKIGAPEGSPDFDLMDYVVRGPASGAPVELAGDILAGSLEEAGDITPGGVGSKIVRLVGNLLTDPVAGAGLVSTADLAGTLSGRATGAVRPPMPRAAPAGRAAGGRMPLAADGGAPMPRGGGGPRPMPGPPEMPPRPGGPPEMPPRGQRSAVPAVKPEIKREYSHPEPPARPPKSKPETKRSTAPQWSHPEGPGQPPKKRRSKGGKIERKYGQVREGQRKARAKLEKGKRGDLP